MSEAAGKARTILGIDPGSVAVGYCIVRDGVPIAKGHVANEKLIELFYSSEAYHTAIECPMARGMIERQAIFDTVYWSGRFAQAAGEFTLFSRGQAMKLLGLPQKTNDAGLKAYLENIYGADRKFWNDQRKSKTGKPLEPREETVHGLLHGWNAHERDALAVALAYIESVK